MQLIPWMSYFKPWPISFKIYSSFIRFISDISHLTFEWKCWSDFFFSKIFSVRIFSSSILFKNTSAVFEFCGIQIEFGELNIALLPTNLIWIHISIHIWSICCTKPLKVFAYLISNVEAAFIHTSSGSNLLHLIILFEFEFGVFLNRCF